MIPFANTLKGMDDVLPKPFTRKSLLEMLEKHLVHLKMMPTTMEQPPPAAAGVTIAAQPSTAQSIKDEGSPAPSPAPPMNNWQPSTQFQGITAVQPTMQQIQPQYVPTAPVTAAAYVDQNGIQYPANQAALNLTTPTRPPNRRQVSDVSSTSEGSAIPKRQRVYPPQTTQVLVNPAQARPG